jgi:serine/threonine-protein phosphatase 5
MESSGDKTMEDKKGEVDSIPMPPPTEPVLPADASQEEKETKAEEFKVEGNEYFKNNKYQESYDEYSKAVDLNVGGKKHCVYLSNRAFASLRLENYGIAIIDAKGAIDIDPTFIKAYYRRACAYFALNQLAAATKDFKKVCKIVPKDKDARLKYESTLKIKKQMDFAACIAVEEQKIEIDPEDIIVEQSYAGMSFEKREDITVDWCVELMEYFKEEKKLHKKYVVMLLIYISEINKEQPSLVDIEVEDTVDITICGDTHGQYYDVLTIFEKNGNPSETNPYLFNGDFVDRGSFSVEVLMLLVAWKIALPNHVHLTRGNHETKNMNKMYGFEGEVKAKYDLKLMDMYSVVL